MQGKRHLLPVALLLLVMEHGCASDWQASNSNGADSSANSRQNLLDTLATLAGRFEASQQQQSTRKLGSASNERQGPTNGLGLLAGLFGTGSILGTSGGTLSDPFAFAGTNTNSSTFPGAPLLGSSWLPSAAASDGGISGNLQKLSNEGALGQVMPGGIASQLGMLLQGAQVQRLEKEGQLGQLGQLLLNATQGQQTHKTDKSMTKQEANQNDELRIVGGTKVGDVNRYPYMTSLRDPLTGTALCGASLIAPYVVVTAAHCLTDNVLFGLPAILLVGRYTSSGADPGNWVSRTCARPIINPNWGYGIGVGDIALCIMDQAVDSIEPIEVAPSNLTIPDNTIPLTVIGWGAEEAGGSTVVDLRSVQVYNENRQSCNVTYEGRIRDTQICAGLEQGGADACQGDSGGPLILEAQPSSSNTNDILVGLVSFGSGCGRPGIPGVYTRVSSYRDWINEVLQSTCVSPSSGPCATYLPPLPPSTMTEPYFNPNGPPSAPISQSFLGSLFGNGFIAQLLNAWSSILRSTPIAGSMVQAVQKALMPASQVLGEGTSHSTTMDESGAGTGAIHGTDHSSSSGNKDNSMAVSGKGSVNARAAPEKAAGLKGAIDTSAASTVDTKSESSKEANKASGRGSSNGTGTGMNSSSNSTGVKGNSSSDVSSNGGGVWRDAEGNALVGGGTAACACNQQGSSGGVPVRQVGCGTHGADDKNTYCYTVGGTGCKEASASAAYPGAAWRLCN